MKSSRVERDFIEIKLFFSKTKIELGRLKTSDFIYFPERWKDHFFNIIFMLGYITELQGSASYAANNNLLASNSTY